MYQSGLTIREALNAVSNNLYVLPAIQREFVWKPDQICRLFDSLMQGYPFGTFLFWKVAPEKSVEFKFFGFVRDYHERDAAHCPDLGSLPNRELTAVLDGQQRLTALNIGLRGSMAVKSPGLWRSNPKAFPKRVLHLDLIAATGDDEEGEKYRFEFLELDKAAADLGALWYPVPNILPIDNPAAVFQWVQKVLVARGMAEDTTLFDRASNMLHRLYVVVHTTGNLTLYSEQSQEIDRVLRIFIRMNSGGTVLSYSDLLLSIAVAQWTKLDARQEVHGLVDDLNRIEPGFNFSKDFVLKAGLMLADIASVGFKVANFNRQNMAILEDLWSDVRQAITLTVELAGAFGLSERTLRADSALLPIAYYLYKKKPAANWLVHPAFADDRERIRVWLVRSLLKASGIWGSGLDTLLTALRDVIRDSHETFPVDALQEVMAGSGKSLDFGPAEIEDLLDVEWGDQRRLFPLLSLLYPFIDPRQSHHIDHIYPRGLLQRRKLDAAKCDATTIDQCLDVRDRLANLQLLGGTLNIVKSDQPPATWFAATYTNPSSLQEVIDRHDLGDLPIDANDFLRFYEARRARLRIRLAQLLGNAATPTASVEELESAPP